MSINSNKETNIRGEVTQLRRRADILEEILRLVKKDMEPRTFEEWLKQCPVEYDEIHETSDKDILTINFHGKDIYWHTIGKDNIARRRKEKE